MKNKLFTGACMVLLALFTSINVNAQDFPGIDKSPMDAASFPSSYRVSDKAVKVTYSRPQLKGRSMATLAPAGKVWRTGANESPEITFYKDATFGGKAVKAGTYSLFTIPGESEWTVILNSNLNQWGAYSYDESKDVARATAKVGKVKGKAVEAFAMTFTEADGGAHLNMAWGDVMVAVPVKM
ncbi:DUF2911 domain-containing protein [Spongiivirga citrea]|uniref:DUF2911 domain-containing protein n=1 Tax=Spongiivirga citrea TaxID=1481457 RepID=A0A6M0CY31_9FLAO|nr:DUF2911 domain-containing protein [Spongiivirga citrea]NER18600.1 DUF2911 domain-containing protein [Spongiivirga citrea]